jgi:hypothetical protein
MKKYKVKPNSRGGWVIIEIETGRGVILFNNRKRAEESCKVLNEEEL